MLGPARRRGSYWRGRDAACSQQIFKEPDICLSRMAEWNNTIILHVVAEMIAFPVFVPAVAVVASFLILPSYAQPFGSFNFLVYNVAGLPAFLSGNGVPGDKETNARTIGSKLAEGGYDVVHMQEVHLVAALSSDAANC